MDHTPNSCPHCGGDLTGIGPLTAGTSAYRPAGFVDAAAYLDHAFPCDTAAVPTVDNHPDRRARERGPDDHASFDIGIW